MLSTCVLVCVCSSARSSALIRESGELAAEGGHSHSPQEQKSDLTLKEFMQSAFSDEGAPSCFVGGCDRAASVYCTRCELDSCEAHRHATKAGHKVVPIGDKDALPKEERQEYCTKHSEHKLDFFCNDDKVS
jgi:hypothetical protein